MAPSVDAGRGGAALPCALYLLLALLVVPVYPHFVSPNELSRWLTAASLVERGTVEVTPLARLLGPRLEDLSEKDGRLFSNKAPGTTLVALAGYVGVRPLAGPAGPAQLRPALTGMRLVASTLPSVLLALALAGAAGALGAPRGRALFGAGALLFGTPLLAYGLLLFSHALVAACLFGAWALLFTGSPGSARRRELLAGALLGLAVLAEYPAAFPGGTLVLAAAVRRDRGRLLRVVAGGIPFALLLAAWNQVSFGSPFALSSGLERDPSFRELARHGLFGISFPSPTVLARLLLDPEKGLLLFVPLLLLAPAAIAAARRRLPLDAFLGLVLPPAAILLTYAGYPNWGGGWSVGPRYLVSALPFLVLPLALRDGSRTEAALLGGSVAACGLATLAFPFVPEGFPAPWASFSAPILAGGLGVPTLLHLAGLHGIASTGLLLGIVAAGGGLSLPARLRLVAAAGAAAWILAPVAWFAFRPLAPPAAVRRGYVVEVYFGREGAIAASLPPSLLPPPRLLRRAELEKTLPPLPWPF